MTYSTSIDTVQDFYKRYRNSEQLDDKVIVMDNHRAHWSEKIQDFLENNRARPEYLPPCMLFLFQSNRNYLVLGESKMEEFTFAVARFGLESYRMDES